ncbi:MFS transporter, partial [Vibrio cholerae O1]|nr:MFS transporter [Vibrio cholerae O1]
MYTLNKHALSFGLFSVFLTGLGFTIINPVVPFLLEPYTSSQNQPLVISFLSSIYALCTFLAAPAL